ncbi:MAG: hypothetical protein HY231_00075 [Acidobacteria bacterium]|nr:hypothetical protein [Acidobacteriota bacterium]
MPTPQPRGEVNWIGTRPNFYDTKLTDEQKVLLAPLPQDQERFAAFLKQKNTGLVRLHPKGKYEPGRTVSVEQAATDMILPLLGGGAYYSFTEKTNKLGPWSEICLEENRLLAGVANNALGLFLDLGDVALEALTQTTAGVNFLLRLAPPKRYAEMVELAEKSSHGLEADGFVYRSVVSVKLNTTYVLRSIIYQKDGFVVHPHEPYYRLRFASLGYDGANTVVAFRVLRRHEDGSVTILWKRLQKFAALKLKRNASSSTFTEIKQWLDREMVHGLSLPRVRELLEAQRIEHTDYVEPSATDEVPAGTVGMIYATIPEIERQLRRVVDLNIRFSFSTKGELLEVAVQKSRR